MTDRIELAILNNTLINDFLNFLNQQIGSIYFKVTPLTLSSTRRVLSEYNFTTRLIVLNQSDNIIFYVYGKRRKINAVFNEHCKNTVIKSNQYLSEIIDISSNINDVVLTDNFEALDLIIKKERKTLFYEKNN